MRSAISTTSRPVENSSATSASRTGNIGGPNLGGATLGDLGVEGEPLVALLGKQAAH
jgi:hypothetical protein